MSEPSPAWPQRFLCAAPRMPDGLWAGFVLLWAFMLGAICGHLLCMWTSFADVRPPSYQQQLDAVEKRLRVLEQRER